MPSIADIQFREATVADVPAMMKSHSDDSAGDPADPRMAAYFNQQQHPQQALLPRVAYVALSDSTVIGAFATRATRIMRYLAIVLASLLLAACSRLQSRAAKRRR